jgi:anti-anti-sigma factor
MALHIPKQTYNRATISATENTIILEGDIDHNDTEDFISPFFKKVASYKHAELIIDITNLDYLNSTGVKCLIEFLKVVVLHSRIIIKTDQKKSWQNRSIYAIQSIDEKHISIIDTSQ